MDLLEESLTFVDFISNNSSIWEELRMFLDNHRDLGIFKLFLTPPAPVIGFGYLAHPLLISKISFTTI